MSAIQIFEPEETTNLVTNPRVALNVDGFGDDGTSTILRSLDRARWGRTSLKVETNGVGLNEGAYVRVDPDLTQGIFTGSVYVRGNGTVRLRLRDATNGVEYTSDRITLDDEHWARPEVLGSIRGALCNDLRLYVETDGSVQTVTFYCDGWQIEEKAYATTYVDGDLENDLPRHEGDAYFRWNGNRNASSSTRSVRFRPAGRPRTLEFEDVGVYPTRISGLGMPPVRLNVQTLGSSEDSIVQNIRAMARPLSLLFWAKRDPYTRVCSPASLIELHQLRESLEALIKPDRGPNAQPFLMRYVDGDYSMDLMAYYEAGLEFEGDIRFPYFNSFGVRFLAVKPYWDADAQDVQQLTALKEVANSDYIIARIDGEWQALGTGAAGGRVREFARDPVTGDIYAVGAFTSMGGVGGTRGIARWDGEQWNSVAGGLDNGTIYDIVIGDGGPFYTNRVVYIGGDFTSVGGLTCYRIAVYDPVADTWDDIGQDDGVDGNVQDLAIDREGRLYLGGAFADSELGTITLNLIAMYDPATDLFRQVGFGPGLEMSTGGGRVRGLMVDLDGETIYVSGLFDREVGGTAGDLDGIAVYSYTENTYTEPGDDGADNSDVRETALAPDGRIYAGGTFTHIGPVDANQCAVFTRYEWLPLGQQGDGIVGVGQIIRNVKVDSRGRVYWGGSFQALTGADFAKYVGTWNGSSFSHLDLELPDPANEVNGILIDGRDIYLGHILAGTAVKASYVHTIENKGKASTGVVLEVLGPGRLLWLENLTTGDVIRMDLEVSDGETVTLDFRKGFQNFTSDLRGNVGDGILPDSDVAEFKLIPGDNRIAFFANDTNGNTEISLRWTVRHWSFDDIVWARSID